MTGILDPLLPYAGYLALILRIWVGANFIIHARPRLGKGLAPTAQALKGLGVPAGATYAATALELVGGVFLILGLLVPIVGGLFVIFMASASIMKKRKMNAEYIGLGQGKPSYEVDALYLALALVLVFLGAGVFSLDGAIGL